MWHDIVLYIVKHITQSKTFTMASKFLIGLGLGIVAGMLLAPDKGSETRKKIAQKGSDLKNKFNDFIDTLHEKFGEMKDEAEEMASDLKGDARSFAGETKPSWGNS
jgi:gas vesicle protein